MWLRIAPELALKHLVIGGKYIFLIRQRLVFAVIICCNRVEKKLENGVWKLEFLKIEVCGAEKSRRMMQKNSSLFTFMMQKLSSLFIFALFF